MFFFTKINLLKLYNFLKLRKNIYISAEVFEIFNLSLAYLKKKKKNEHYNFKTRELQGFIGKLIVTGKSIVNWVNYYVKLYIIHINRF